MEKLLRLQGKAAIVTGAELVVDGGLISQEYRSMARGGSPLFHVRASPYHVSPSTAAGASSEIDRSTTSTSARASSPGG